MASIEKSTAQITKLYRAAQRDIIFEIKGATTYRRQELALISRNITKVLERLGKTTSKEVRALTEKHYRDGFDQTVGSLKSAGAKGISAKFSVLDTEALAAMAGEITSLLGEANQGAQRHTLRMLSKGRAKATLSRIARGRLLGKTLNDIKRDIEKELDAGMVVLRDRAGRKWAMDTYAEMVTRTNMRKATNDGVMNKLAAEGADLVTVSDHGTDHEECRVWEGKLLSVSGDTKTFDGQSISTVEQATSAGLFHPNCKHRLFAHKPEIVRFLT